ncbi:hypothetical protein [Acinetobacter sp. YK3]|uniref:hypothetical protein n=1 Tax=Acinetobacter sp. YK3 TaxID=1860097 RepID=UPI00084C4650|nr:hypothetical protein [Acinetobacter sp. YK3]OEC92322.1 hypothetical protein A9Z07_01885 [Acinetobacter sp. YK3]
MTKLLLAGVLGLGLAGCSSINYEANTKPPIVPKNEAHNTFKMPEHGIMTDQDVSNVPEHAEYKSKYSISF